MVSDAETVAPWRTLNRGAEEDFTVMRVRREVRRHAVDGREGIFTVAAAPPWVNILPITEHNDVVLVEQFRHGSGTTTLEIPGGVLHDGETPMETAMRECLEETGFAADAPPVLLGEVLPNPAFMENSCTVYVWNGCRRQRDQQLDPLEDIQVHVVPMNTFIEYVRGGVIRHSLVLSAVALALLQSRLSPGSIREHHG